MVVGVCRLRLSIEGNDSLKGKRAPLRSLIGRVRARFNVAVAEVDSQDELQVGVLGLSVVSNDSGHAHQMLDRIVAFIERDSELPLVERETEIVHFGDALHEDAMGIAGSWADFESGVQEKKER